MRTLYRSLNERDRRRYAAIEGSKLGYGGRTCIRGVLGCDYNALHLGMEALKELPHDDDLLVTALTPVQRTVFQLLGLKPAGYGRWSRLRT